MPVKRIDLVPLNKILYTIILMLFSIGIYAQETATISGTLKADNGEALENANIAIVGVAGGTKTDRKGKYSLKIPANQSVQLGITYIGFTTIIKLFNLKPNEKVNYSPQLKASATLIPGFIKKEEGHRNETMIKIKPIIASKFTSASGSFEAILKTLPGVTSNNELSSSYSVRGGNFDENLVYVNDIQIYRPFLIRAGRQEGLSFINSNLVSDIKFSAGGFDAKYGDKMSSVLDVTYKEPEEFAGSFSMSLQGASLHLEGASKNHRLTYLTGVRYKSNQYVLQSLDTDGEYRPSFFDVQTYLTYDISEKWEIGLGFDEGSIPPATLQEPAPKAQAHHGEGDDEPPPQPGHPPALLECQPITYGNAHPPMGDEVHHEGRARVAGASKTSARDHLDRVGDLEERGDEDQLGHQCYYGLVVRKEPTEVLPHAEFDDCERRHETAAQRNSPPCRRARGVGVGCAQRLADADGGGDADGEREGNEGERDDRQQHHVGVERGLP